MTSTAPQTQDLANPRMVRFESHHAQAIADWVETEEMLRWVAPSTVPPLTAEKVAGWKKPEGEAWVLVDTDETTPLGYGELNPMRREPRHLWLGHIIVRPDLRGRGLGKMLVQHLLDRARSQYHAVLVSLIVFPDNTDAIACYRQAGFQLVREESHSFGGGPKHRLFRFQFDVQSV